MAVDGAAYADTVLTESTVTGIATDKLQEYMYAAELVDVSTETLTKSMAKQIKSMKSVHDGSKTMAAAYDALGVSVTDSNGDLRDGDTVYWELIDALGKVENETERDALAMQVAGCLPLEERCGYSARKRPLRASRLSWKISSHRATAKPIVSRRSNAGQ